MYLEMTQAEFDALPARSELKGNPLPNQYYRAEKPNTIVKPVFRHPHDQQNLIWDAYAVTITDHKTKKAADPKTSGQV